MLTIEDTADLLRLVDRIAAKKPLGFTDGMLLKRIGPMIGNDAHAKEALLRRWVSVDPQACAIIQRLGVEHGCHG